MAQENQVLTFKTLVVKLGNDRGHFVNISKLHEGLYTSPIPQLFPVESTDDQINEQLINIYDRLTNGDTTTMDHVTTRLDEMCDIIKLNVTIHPDHGY
jgi:hypothetical protein